MEKMDKANSKVERLEKKNISILERRELHRNL